MEIRTAIIKMNLTTAASLIIGLLQWLILRNCYEVTVIPRIGAIHEDFSAVTIKGERNGVIRLVVFLGNPGREYERTRHNVGWMVADSLPFAAELPWRERFKGLAASFRGRYFLKPATYMNRSGESVGACASYYRIDPSEILVTHDDMEVPFGEVQLRTGGGLGGHNGLKDLVRVLGTREFARVRVGISRPMRQSPGRYVLSRFSLEEEARLPQVLAKAGDLVGNLLRL